MCWGLPGLCGSMRWACLCAVGHPAPGIDLDGALGPAQGPVFQVLVLHICALCIMMASHCIRFLHLCASKLHAEAHIKEPPGYGLLIAVSAPAAEACLTFTLSSRPTVCRFAVYPDAGHCSCWPNLCQTLGICSWIDLQDVGQDTYGTRQQVWPGADSC